MTIKTHSEIIDEWPSIEALAVDIEVKYPTVSAWYYRDTIPNKYWNVVITAGKKRRIKLTHKIFMESR